MEMTTNRRAAQSRIPRIIKKSNTSERTPNVTDYFGELTFDFLNEDSIPNSLKKELVVMARRQEKIKIEQAQVIAAAVRDWAIKKGCTHFCHWFQPLTGSTAEKHDAFLTFGDGGVVEKFDASQLMQGEPDASSFPSGGARTTFEARGYTSWDISSPFFIVEGANGSTLCIPTAFISYHGDALDIKTPLLRSINKLNNVVTKFLHHMGHKDVTNVSVCCGPEQEYFLVDKSFYYSRPDLVMTGRTLFGLGTSKNQQLDDHYFGSIPQRVKNFMDELNFELHRLGIPAKTQHNEVAPGQFELAPIFENANVAADHNQLTMSTIERVAERHDFKALLHEKPFPGINGSGKHVNWSMATDTGINLLNPTKTPQDNPLFLASCALVLRAVYRHADAMRMSIASHGNDHRLGANEAPPSIISAYLGDALNKVFSSIASGKSVKPSKDGDLDVGASQLAMVAKDNTDRNRTSPFAFTGNKFEFRAVGSSHAIGFPLTVLNTAVAESFSEANPRLEEIIKSGKSSDDAAIELVRECLNECSSIIFNGDNYSDDWVKEAQKRGLPNLRTSADAFAMMDDTNAMKFLTEMGILSDNEIQMRRNAFIEKYNTCREIEFDALNQMVFQFVLPSAFEYKTKLATLIRESKAVGVECSIEEKIMKRLVLLIDSIHSSAQILSHGVENLSGDALQDSAEIANHLLKLSETIANSCNELEQIIPSENWKLPTYLEMLFVR